MMIIYTRTLIVSISIHFGKWSAQSTHQRRRNHFGFPMKCIYCHQFIWYSFCLSISLFLSVAISLSHLFVFYWCLNWVQFFLSRCWHSSTCEWIEWMCECSSDSVMPLNNEIKMRYDNNDDDDISQLIWKRFRNITYDWIGPLSFALFQSHTVSGTCLRFIGELWCDSISRSSTNQPLPISIRMKADKKNHIMDFVCLATPSHVPSWRVVASHGDSVAHIYVDIS